MKKIVLFSLLSVSFLFSNEQLVKEQKDSCIEKSTTKEEFEKCDLIGVLKEDKIILNNKRFFDNKNDSLANINGIKDCILKTKNQVSLDKCLNMKKNVSEIKLDKTSTAKTFPKEMNESEVFKLNEKVEKKKEVVKTQPKKKSTSPVKKSTAT